MKSVLKMSSLRIKNETLEMENQLAQDAEFYCTLCDKEFLSNRSYNHRRHVLEMHPWVEPKQVSKIVRMSIVFWPRL